MISAWYPSAPKQARTGATPAAHPTSHDDPLPEIPRDITHFPNNKPAQQANEDIHDRQEREGSDGGYVFGCERRHDTREYQRGEGEVHRDERGTLGCCLRKQAFPSEDVPEEDRQVPVNNKRYCHRKDEGIESDRRWRFTFLPGGLPQNISETRRIA